MEKKRGLYSSNTPAYLAASGLIDSGGVETPGPAVSRGRRGAPIRDSGTGSTRQQQQQRRSKLGACLKREERWLSPPLLRSASPPARLRLGLRSVTNQEAAKQRPFLLYNILYQSVCLRSDFLFPHFVRERSTQVRRRRADGARTEEGGRIPSWSSRGVEMRVTGGARGQGGQQRWETDRRTRQIYCSPLYLSAPRRRSTRERAASVAVSAFRISLAFLFGMFL